MDCIGENLVNLGYSNIVKIKKYTQNILQLEDVDQKNLLLKQL